MTGYAVRRLRRTGSRRRKLVMLATLVPTLSMPMIVIMLNVPGLWGFVLAEVPVLAMLVLKLPDWIHTVAGLRKKIQANSEQALARSSVRSLTNLAAWLAGPARPALRDEWRAHLAGESGHDPLTWPKVRKALGFVASGIRFRLADASGLAWRPADAVLGSRTLSNLFVWGPVIAVLVAIVRHDGRFGLVADDQDPVALGAFLYVVIKTGRWWRGVKPPEPKARRARSDDGNG